MSLLQQDSTGLDDAARGEELTKGTSHVVVAAIIATAVVGIAIAIYVIAGQKPPVATGQILAVWAHPQHTETSGLDASGAAIEKESFDEVLLFAQVTLHNQTDHPIILSNATVSAMLDDGVHVSYAANKTDYDRVFVAYPNLPVPHGKALSALDTEIDPGQTVDGTIFFYPFKVSKQQWDAHKDVSFTFAFRYQPNVVIVPHVAITER